MKDIMEVCIFPPMDPVVISSRFMKICITCELKSNSPCSFLKLYFSGLQGLNKQETVDKHGKDQVLVWRRSYDIPPPECEESSEHYPGNDPMYANVPKEDLPKTESLELTEKRFMIEWDDNLVPLIKSGKKVIIAAHGNTLRALVKHLDGISKDDITGLNIPTGVPLIYELDEDMKPITQEGAIAPLSGKYLGDLEKVKARIGAVAAQTK
uniref:Phosphoglycerate mutase n=1 Tax=Pseudo-nitzschia australis TaxID=44445 RepID=A0A7S4EE24_9STRA